MQLALPEQQSSPSDVLLQYYEMLFTRLGPQGWWPARTRLEVILGAILTQNTNWNNAALALKQLRGAGLLKLTRLRGVSLSELEACVRPAGFCRQKARTIRAFLDFLFEKSSSSLARLLNQPAEELRRDLLGIRGLGPETVDAILLYAGRKPYFVADAYTRRILSRHGLITQSADYAATQQFLHRHLPGDESLYNEFHALLVEIGKQFCRRNEALCGGCPLKEFLPQNQQESRGEPATAAGALQSALLPA